MPLPVDPGATAKAPTSLVLYNESASFAMDSMTSCSSLAESCSVDGRESKAKVANAHLITCQGCGAISRSQIDAISDLQRFQNVLIADGRASMVAHWLDSFWCSLDLSLIWLFDVVSILRLSPYHYDGFAVELLLDFPWQTPYLVERRYDDRAQHVRECAACRKVFVGRLIKFALVGLHNQQGASPSVPYPAGSMLINLMWALMFALVSLMIASMMPLRLGPMSPNLISESSSSPESVSSASARGKGARGVNKCHHE